MGTLVCGHSPADSKAAERGSVRIVVSDHGCAAIVIDVQQNKSAKLPASINSGLSDAKKGAYSHLCSRYQVCLIEREDNIHPIEIWQLPFRNREGNRC
jgi:hypothetical protein